VKLLAVAALLFLAPPAEVRFEKDGLRVGDALVQGSVLELKGVGTSALLASGSSLEALSSSVEVGISADRTLTLEPGLRVSREADGYRFVAHADRRIRFTAAGETIVAVGAVRVTPTAEGWKVGDLALEGTTLRAGLQAQDDTKDNLDRMLQAKDKMNTGGVPRLSTRTARLFHGSPLTSGQAADSINVRLIPQVSPSGAP